MHASHLACACVPGPGNCCQRSCFHIAGGGTIVLTEIHVCEPFFLGEQHPTPPVCSPASRSRPSATFSWSVSSSMDTVFKPTRLSIDQANCLYYLGTTQRSFRSTSLS